MSEIIITAVRVIDLRFPTSRHHIGSDAVNKDPDYSAAYCVLETNTSLEGHGLTFTLGRGNDLVEQAVRYLSRYVVNRSLNSITEDLRAFARLLTDDTQFRWLGPEKGVIHLATGALLNAVWDLYARAEKKPLWRLLAEMEPCEVVKAVDFRYIDDALTEREAIEILASHRSTQRERLAVLERQGYPAYTTSAGWFGYSEDKIRRLAKEALAEGWTHFKLKVGGEPADDLRRGHIVREEIGWTNKLMVDANQKWGVLEAIDRTRQLAELKPWWMEEPTNPDDILGHARIRREVPEVRVATGEHVHNRIMFKQYLQAGAIDVVQLDSCRVGGVNENLAILLMAAKFKVPVCPHAGGVGLCEYVQHLSAFDYLAVSASLDDRVIEFVDHLHEHFVTPVRIRNGHYLLPTEPGYSIQIKEESLARFAYPDGEAWQETMQVLRSNGKA
ncbi:enolase C-terminal domain-like protein [Edaphobacter sp.]|uniref:enolase C-terminal domain-like protein n=1 Tax=Edaphobacter sp. TaxID=1934404 RepID=UPI002DBE3DFF|nr:enolase C-terminal domain-like protein [Edaphobacter sp.]HEU5339832.1 enolase C-terminal domain-like protein [Edaphobacter sp.]